MRGRNAVLGASAVFNFVPFLLIVVGVSVGMLPAAYLCVLVLLPMAVFLWRSLRRFVDGLPEEIVLKKWFGPMGDFPAYREAGIGLVHVSVADGKESDFVFCPYSLIGKYNS